MTSCDLENKHQDTSEWKHTSGTKERNSEWSKTINLAKMSILFFCSFISFSFFVLLLLVLLLFFLFFCSSSSRCMWRCVFSCSHTHVFKWKSHTHPLEQMEIYHGLLHLGWLVGTDPLPPFSSSTFYSTGINLPPLLHWKKINHWPTGFVSFIVQMYDHTSIDHKNALKYTKLQKKQNIKNTIK